MLPQKAVEQFRELYREIHGVELSFEEASVLANALIKLYRAVSSDK